MAQTATGKQDRFEAGGARKTLLSIAFILLLPFFASLPAMLLTRLSHGLWRDTIGLAVMSVAFAAIMAILAAQLLFAIRARVTIGEKAVGLTMPRGQGPTPKFRYERRVIPYDDISSVETRREIYGAPMATVLLRGARIVTKEGDNISLGFIHDNDTETFPVMQIADTIAQRAGISVTDHGAVHRSVRAKAMGLKHSPDQGEPLAEQEIDTANAQHRRAIVAILVFLGALVAIGLAADIFLGG